jgi:membrane-associated PAP2 superfamily phosphatase
VYKRQHISCWPAGHASGGFALLSLFFLFKSRRNKIFALIFGLSVGWMMGLYKMLIGDHFLSHTIITMILAWLIILVIAKIVNKKESYMGVLQTLCKIRNIKSFT